MTSDHPIRRVLARFCSVETMSRIVDPVLADMRWEDGRTTIGGCVALAKALALHGLTLIPSRLAAACSNDDYALVRGFAFTAAGAIVVAIALTSPPFSDGVRRIHTSLYALGVRRIPQALVISLPSMLVVTIPTVFGSVVSRRSIVGRALLLTAAAFLLTVAVTVWVVPRINQPQSYRAPLTPATLPDGPAEAGFAALRAQIRDYRTTHGGQSLASRLEYAFQLRAAVMVSAIPFGVAGIAIATMTRRRGLSASIAVCAVAAYWTLMLLEDSVANAQIIRGGFLPEYLCAWTPNLLMLIASSAAVTVS